MLKGAPAARRFGISLPFLFIAVSAPVFAQSANSAASQNPQPRNAATLSQNSERQPDELKQELDADALALSQIPADPLLQSDPFAPIVRPFNEFAREVYRLTHLTFGATYTFLDQYATNTPQGSIRHN